MPTTRPRVKVSYTADEKARVEALAVQLGLSVSELHRRLVLGHRLPSPEDFAAAQAVRDILAVSADLARLGNLQKLTLDEADGVITPTTVAQIEALIAEITTTQAALRETAKAAHALLHPRRTARDRKADRQEV